VWILKAPTLKCNPGAAESQKEAARDLGAM
jgi:hypothetical protein